MGKRRWHAASVALEKSDGWCRTFVTTLSCGKALSVEEAKGVAVATALQQYPGYAVTGVQAMRVKPVSTEGES